jgi:uncharacterized protein (UPF0276 family)
MADAWPPNFVGVGVVYVHGLETLFEPVHPLIQVMEIEPQTLSAPTTHDIHPEALQWLQQVPVTKLVHGVGIPLAGTVPPSKECLEGFLRSIDHLRAAWVSEHLNFMRVRRDDRVCHTGMMCPPRQTMAGVRVAAANIRRLQALLDVELAVENPVNYLRPQGDELKDGDFLAKVVEEADCKILLDLHNVWTNACNGRQQPLEYLNSLPLERVWELHLAGGFAHKGFWLDAHSGAVPTEVIQLAEGLMPRLPNLRAIIYEILPEHIPRLGLARIEAELETLNSLSEKRIAPVAPRTSTAVTPEILQQPIVVQDALEVSDWEGRVSNLVAKRPGTSELRDLLAEDPGICIMQELVWRFRAGAIVDLLPRSSALLRKAGVSTITTFLDRYFENTDATDVSADEAFRFANWLKPLSDKFAGLEPALELDVCELRQLSERYAQSSVST